MTWLPGILAAYAILLVGTLSPGPAVAMLLGIAMRDGRPAALTACLGIAAGSMTLNLLTLAGIGLLLTQLSWTMSLLKAFGTVYLLWLAWSALRRATATAAVSANRTTPRGAAAQLAQGFAMQVTNPKAVGFWLAISAVGAVATAPIPVIAAYVLCGGLLSFAGHAGWALALSSPTVQQAYSNARKSIEATLGAIFAFAAFKLATSES